MAKKKRNWLLSQFLFAYCFFVSKSRFLTVALKTDFVETRINIVVLVALSLSARHYEPDERYGSIGLRLPADANVVERLQPARRYGGSVGAIHNSGCKRA